MESSMELGWYEIIFEKCSRTPNSYTTNERFEQFCKGTEILPFLKIGHDKRFCCIYWKTAANTAK